MVCSQLANRAPNKGNSTLVESKVWNMSGSFSAQLTLKYLKDVKGHRNSTWPHSLKAGICFPKPEEAPAETPSSPHQQYVKVLADIIHFTMLGSWNLVVTPMFKGGGGSFDMISSLNHSNSKIILIWINFYMKPKGPSCKKLTHLCVVSGIDILGTSIIKLVWLCLQFFRKWDHMYISKM